MLKISSKNTTMSVPQPLFLLVHIFSGRSEFCRKVRVNLDPEKKNMYKKSNQIPSTYFMLGVKVKRVASIEWTIAIVFCDGSRPVSTHGPNSNDKRKRNATHAPGNSKKKWKHRKLHEPPKKFHLQISQRWHSVHLSNVHRITFQRIELVGHDLLLAVFLITICLLLFLLLLSLEFA